jgi:hypothetical protein
LASSGLSSFSLLAPRPQESPIGPIFEVRRYNWRYNASEERLFRGALAVLPEFDLIALSRATEGFTGSEIEQLFRKRRTGEQRYVVALLFDAGDLCPLGLDVSVTA